MNSLLSSVIAPLEAKSGKEWTPEEREACRGWLISEKWEHIQREIGKVIRLTAADHRAGVTAAFLNGELESILRCYEPGHNGIWPYIVVCLRRYCWRAARRLTLERQLTREMAANEEDAALPDIDAPSAGAPPDWLLDKQLHELVRRELARLKPDYRDPLLCRIRGASYDKIACELGLSAKLVKIRIFRARQELRKRLRALWPSAAF